MSSVLTAVIAVALILASAVIVGNALTGMLASGRSTAGLGSMKAVVTEFDAVARELAFEADGSQRAFKRPIPGIVQVAGKEDRVKFRVGPVDLLEAGSMVQDGDMRIAAAGEQLLSAEKDVDNDGTPELVLENGAVLFSVRKVGSPSSWAPINTTSLIRIGNKRANVNITPITRIFIDDMANTSYGTGYTELTSPGSGQASAGIRVFVNATGLVQYEVLFTLRAAQDFVEAEVKHVRSA